MSSTTVDRVCNGDADTMNADGTSDHATLERGVNDGRR